MRYYIGIDLGTTNSAICSYDGIDSRIWKSPEQNDVTPSAIFIDKRGNKHIGKRAYDRAPVSPGSSATLFKRIMGTKTPIKFESLGIEKTPVECSSEILKVLYGYLPEEIRQSEEVGVVITVPAAFNQMQKDATVQAAEMAGIGMVALMQEPVAAVMSVMRHQKNDGRFLIYDLGGGTLDIAIAESLSGRVNLLANGGIARCGGRDFDQLLFDNIVRPWLNDNYNLPENFSVDPNYTKLIRLCTWAIERAKIELSAREETSIILTDEETRTSDKDGQEIYIDIPISRNRYIEIIDDKVEETIDAARETLEKAHLTTHDIQNIIYVGGPTNFKPLRDKVAFELGLQNQNDTVSSGINPMTAVAEGASIFAESIDWETESKGRKGSKGKLVTQDELGLTFNYISRTPSNKAKIGVKLGSNDFENFEFQVDSLDTGWTTGRMHLDDGIALSVSLSQDGPNHFKVSVYDKHGDAVKLNDDEIVIVKTAATVDAIPASHTISIEALDKLGGRPVLKTLVEAGDPLPKKGSAIFKSAETLKAGAPGSINIKLWEGEIKDEVNDNRLIGTIKISGSDFDHGVISAGSDIKCDFEMRDSGHIFVDIEVPSISRAFNNSGKSFYSRPEGELDFNDAGELIENEVSHIVDRIDNILDVVNSPRLVKARTGISEALDKFQKESTADRAQEIYEKIMNAKKLLARVRKENLKEIRTLDHSNVVGLFNEYVRKFAKPIEERAFDTLATTAGQAIDDTTSQTFEEHLDELKSRNFEILWQQDWFVVEKFKYMVEAPYNFTDKAEYQRLSEEGWDCLSKDDIQSLRAVVAHLSTFQLTTVSESDMLESANIIAKN